MQYKLSRIANLLGGFRIDAAVFNDEASDVADNRSAGPTRSVFEGF